MLYLNHQHGTTPNVEGVREMAFEVVIQFTAYDKLANTCQAKITQTGEVFEIDPFVGCAISMTDEQYSDDFGYTIVGKKYCMKEYTVYDGYVVPHAGGLVSLEAK
jgi:hypothetical protein